MYHWVLYAMFMFHPENELHWRITDQLKFKSFVECESYYRKNTDGLYKGLKDYMTGNHGAPDLGKYTLMEMGCSMAKNQTPELESRIPLHTMPDLEKFISKNPSSVGA